MNDNEFHDLIDDMFNKIEDAVDLCEVDIDCENAGGVLTLTCADSSSIILSRQLSSHELWIAARSGGYHLCLKEGTWYCEKYNQSFEQLFSEITRKQAGTIIRLS